MRGLANRADEPIGNERGNPGAVLFEHQHVAIAVSAGLFEPGEVDLLNPGFPQVLDSAVVAGGFASNKHDRDARQVGQAPRGRFLAPAPHQIGMVALRFQLNRQLVGGSSASGRSTRPRALRR